MRHLKLSARNKVAFNSHNENILGKKPYHKSGEVRIETRQKRSKIRRKRIHEDEKEYLSILPTLSPYRQTRNNFTDENGSLATIIPLEIRVFFLCNFVVDNSVTQLKFSDSVTSQLMIRLSKSDRQFASKSFENS